jgi:hypothetical protein
MAVFALLAGGIVVLIMLIVVSDYRDARRGR